MNIAVERHADGRLVAIPPEVEAAKCLLEHYSGILPEDAEAHIEQIRDKAWDIHPYGAIGSFRFLDMKTTFQDVTFQSVVKRLSTPGSSETLLDVGCCLGYAIRQLVTQGVPGERLFGTDLQQGFIDLGYDLFRDRGRIQATFVCGNLLQEDDNRLDQLHGKIDIVYAEAFFHLFEREGQKKAAKRIVPFLKQASQDAMIFGWNGGPKVSGWEKYVLNNVDFREMWAEVGKETGTSWRTATTIDESDDWIRVKFVVHRS